MNISFKSDLPVAFSVATAQSFSGASRRHGFTLIEAMASVGLLSILVITCMIGIFTLLKMSGRTADYTAATAVVEAKVQDIRAATYNPPNYPWSTNAVFITNVNAVALNQSGVSFDVPGTVISKIEPAGSAGHLVAVSGTFTSGSKPFTITIQTIVNKFSGGQN